MGKVRKSGVSIDVSKPKNRPEKLLKMLADLVHEEKIKKHPSIPVRAIPRTRFKDSTSNSLTQAILSWLSLNGCWATRVSSAGRYIAAKGRFIPSTTKLGTADIHAVIGGRHVSIEVKIGRDKQSEPQKKTQREVEASGGLYFIAKDFDSFIEFYNQITNGRR